MKPLPEDGHLPFIFLAAVALAAAFLWWPIAALWFLITGQDFPAYMR